MNEDPPHVNLYKIGAIAALTGLSTHTIRAWERRYGMELADRTDGGTRLYSESALERLKLLRQLLDHGESISVLSQLSIEELNERLLPFSVSSRHGSAVRSNHSGGGKVAVWGHSPFERKRHSKPGGRSIRVEYEAVLESEFIDYIDRNVQGLDAGVVFVEFLNPAVLEALVRMSGNYRDLLWVLVFNMASSGDLLQLMENGVHLVRGPLPEGILVDTLVTMLGGRFAAGAKGEERDDPVLEPMFSQNQLSELMHSGNRCSNDFSGHLSMLIQNLMVFENYCGSLPSESTESTLETEVRNAVGRARHTLEKALNRVCLEQGLTVKD